MGTVSHVAVVESPIWSTHTPLLEPDTIQTPAEQADKGWIVTVYDNSFNTYLEVMTILMLATKCDAEEAEIETWEIDNLGQSVVHRDSDQACQEAAKLIATIGIRAEATPDPLA
ncbi:MAG: ATP-dependent Clp protease adaptor ClpS [Fimbriimonadaceae bacterium]